jgi:hypothetical protein
LTALECSGLDLSEAEDSKRFALFLEKIENLGTRKTSSSSLESDDPEAEFAGELEYLSG